MKCAGCVFNSYLWSTLEFLLNHRFWSHSGNIAVYLPYKLKLTPGFFIDKGRKKIKTVSELKFTKTIDEEHVVKLDSTLIYAEWCNSIAYVGQTAAFEVGTSFVGNGATIKVKGKSKSGKKLGKINDKIKYNKYIGRFEIPEDIEIGDEIYFEVTLPDNGLEHKSSHIPVYPCPEVSNMKWSANEARRGDVLTLTADIKGLYSGNEVTVTIYEYDADGAHDRITEVRTEIVNDKIEIMWEYEYFDDTAKILSEDKIQEYNKNAHYAHPEYFFTIKIGETEYGKKQESGILKFKDWFDFKLLDEGGEPLANEEYILHLSDGSERKGSLDAEGYGREEGLPPGKVTAEFKNIGYVTLSDEYDE